MSIVRWSGALVSVCVENLENVGDIKWNGTQTASGTWPNTEH
jgi:hypothetical protein